MSAPMTMRDIAKLPENLHCADCDEDAPEWASMNLGVFLCIKCAGIHRNLGVEHSKVRSIKLDTTCWDVDSIQYMQNMGNARAKEIYECRAPKFFIRPSEADTPVIRENWIRAKYVRKEFLPKEYSDEKDTDPSIYQMPQPVLEDFLSKRSPRNESKWQKRWFVLHSRYLSYFESPGDSYPSGKIEIAGVTVQIEESTSYDQQRQTFSVVTPDRTYTLATDTAEQLFIWVHAIRRASLFYSHPSYSRFSQPIDGPVPYYSESDGFVRQGWIKKQGGRRRTWHKRWFSLSENALFYAKNADESKPEAIPLKSGCFVMVGCQQKTKKDNSLCVITDDRTYFFVAQDQNDMQEWIQSIAMVIENSVKLVAVDFRDF